MYSGQKTELLKKSEAENNEECRKIWNEMIQAWQDMKALELRRASAERRWEDWRSLNKARGQGL